MAGRVPPAGGVNGVRLEMSWICIDLDSGGASGTMEGRINDAKRCGEAENGRTGKDCAEASLENQRRSNQQQSSIDNPDKLLPVAFAVPLPARLKYGI